jgi:hypothetical protein
MILHLRLPQIATKRNYLKEAYTKLTVMTRDLE